MKTQQEISEMAEMEYPTPITGLDYLDLRKGFIKGYQAANEDKKELLEALKELVFLHVSEKEGIESGQPTDNQWFDAVDKASKLIKKHETI